MTASRSRRGPRAPHGASKAALVQSALDLMRRSPIETVSARSIAEAAGFDPALITYHFGGRSGLMAAVAESAAEMILAQYETSVAQGQSGTRDSTFLSDITLPALVMTREPLLSQLYVAELLLRGDDRTALVLHDMTVAYFQHTQDVVASAEQRGELRRFDPTIVLYTLTALSLFHPFVAPWLRRHPAAPAADVDASIFAARIVEAALNGCLVTPRPEVAGDSRIAQEASASAHDGITNSSVVDGSDSHAFSRHDLIQAAVEFLREDPTRPFSPEALASWVGCDIAVVDYHFPDPEAAIGAIARAAVSHLPPRLDPANLSSVPTGVGAEVEERLVASATELVGSVRGPHSARRIATHAGCDPALVTYYFGGRSGLLRAVAERVLSGLVAQFEAGYDPALPIADRMQASLSGPVTSLLATPLLARFLVDQFLVRGDISTDRDLQRTIEPYLSKIRLVVDEGTRDQTLALHDGDVLFYAVGVLPLYFAAVIPILHQALRGPVPSQDLTSSATELIEIVLDGIAVAPPRGRRT